MHAYNKVFGLHHIITYFSAFCILILVSKLQASYQQLQADLNEEKELQAKLIQAIQFSRPNDFLIAQLKDKLLAQETESSSHQKRLEILNGSLHCSKLYHCLIVLIILCITQLSNLGLCLLLALQFQKVISTHVYSCTHLICYSFVLHYTVNPRSVCYVDTGVQASCHDIVKGSYL